VAGWQAGLRVGQRRAVVDGPEARSGHDRYPRKRRERDQGRIEARITLAPGEGVEIKLTMIAGERVRFSWTVEGGVVNYDQHGDGGGGSMSYEKGRAVPNQEGELEAAFDGKHGWFWRNRGKAPVTVILLTEGPYTAIERLV
jgi:hypothetical protein